MEKGGSESQLEMAFEVLVIILYSVYEATTIYLVTKLKKKYANKWLYPFAMAYTVFLSIDYFFEIAIAICELSNLGDSLTITLRIITVFVLHSAFITIMYSTVFSTKYILILEQRLATYYILLTGIILSVILTVGYVGIRIWFALAPYPELTEYYYENTLALALYVLYGTITLFNVLIKRRYEYPKYAKRRFYLWTIVVYFFICGLAAACEMVFFAEDTKGKFVYNVCADLVIDALPMYCVFLILTGTKREEKNKGLLSFFDHSSANYTTN